jgi:hypothetical protein
MNLLYDIRKLFAEVNKNNAISISAVDSDYPAWVVKYDDWYGVGIPMQQFAPISEKFSNVKMISKVLKFDNKETSLLLLTSTIESLRYEFATVCAQFIDPGPNGKERNSLLNDPVSWFEKWKSLMGNSVRNKTAYAILGEMLVYKHLLRQGIPVKWSGLNQATHDIESNECNYEVKSTVQRYGLEVTINSQFQMQDSNTDLYLIFCRLESSMSGLSIDDTIMDLKGFGVNVEEINNYLEKHDLEEGSSARMEKYTLLEMRKYKVGEHFPTITSKSFVNTKIPESITQITYTVDLSGIEYENWTS